MASPLNSYGVKEDMSQSTALRDFGSRLETLISDAQSNIGRIQSVLDRAFGPEPEKAQGEGPRAVVSGAIGTIGARLDDLAVLLQQQSNIIGRLEKIA